jgi:DNA-binding CsgD family transcriptional regulator
LSSWASHHACAKDALCLWAADARGGGAFIVAPLHERMTLAGHVRHRWQVVGTHLAIGFRLRHALTKLDAGGLPKLEAPRQEIKASRTLRNAAVVVDGAGGRMSEADEGMALRLWQSLAGGGCSLLDLFDVGGRRYVIAVCNPPGVNDPHRLTKREAEVAEYAALGESGKQIGFRLGLSTSRVSGVLHDVKRKLRVHTQAELVNKMRRLHAV